MSALAVLGVMLRPSVMLITTDVVFVPCPTCRGTARNPEAPVALVNDDGTCLTCCDPGRPWYAGWHGWVRAPTTEDI